jgi:hypothetical protein
MPTLQDLTLKLSRDLSTHHRQCLERLDRLERERTAALRGLRGAASIVRDFEKAKADAAATREKTLAKAQADLAAAERKAAQAREAQLRAIERRFRDADAAAVRAKQAAEAKARAQLNADLDKISRTLAMPDQILARRDAEDRFAAAIAAAHAAHLRALDENKAAQTDELRAAVSDEAAAARVARDNAAVESQAAAIVAERAAKAAETAMREALTAVDGANDVQVEFDARRVDVKEGCRQREAQLFAAFRAAREKLARP